MDNDNSNVRQLLVSLGLSHTETETYIALLELETVSIRKVAEKSGINRGTTYEAIKKLVHMGLVSVRQSGKREYYSAESPEKIFDIIRDKRKELLAIQQHAQTIVPALLAQQIRPQGRPLVRYYEDDEGVVAILRDVLQTCRSMDAPEYYSYSSKPLRQYLYRKFPSFTQRRIDEGIWVKVIAVGDGGDKAESSERKWIAEPQPGVISSYTIIYGDKVAHISISNDFTPYGVVIEDHGTAAMQRLLFGQLWATL